MASQSQLIGQRDVGETGAHVFLLLDQRKGSNHINHSPVLQLWVVTHSVMCVCMHMYVCMYVYVCHSLSMYVYSLAIIL